MALLPRLSVAREILQLARHSSAMTNGPGIMNFKGERFHIPLDEDDQYDEEELKYINASKPQDPSLFGNAFVKDVQERSTTSVRPPVAPKSQITSNGFPAHKKRTAVSRFKQARAGVAPAKQETTPDTFVDNDHENSEPTSSVREKTEIDRENQQRIAQMSEDQIEKERKELMEGLSPSLIERLLRRANINTNTGPDDFPQPKPENPVKRVTLEEAKTSSHGAEENGDRQAILIPVPSPSGQPGIIHETPSIHFPHPPEPPDLDPSSTTFLTDLHEKYFPSLPSDPSVLAWMSDPAADKIESPSSPSQESIPSAALRFSFRGTLIPPRTALSIPVTAGLHHHGEAPESAGYTIPELAHLSRSSFPAQRCVAFQTLGRLMFRLGKGEFGLEESTMVLGLWKCIREGRVLETLEEETGRLGGHMSAKAYATEALWLWQTGGGQKWKAA